MEWQSHSLRNIDNSVERSYFLYACVHRICKKPVSYRPKRVEVNRRTTTSSPVNSFPKRRSHTSKKCERIHGQMDAPNNKSNSSYSRKFPRYPFDCRIKAHVFRDGTTLDLWGRSTELALDGIGGTLTRELEPGEVVTLEIPLPLATYPLKLRAIVRYRHGLHHGFEFLTISPADRNSIERVCEMLRVSTESR
jgi:PilZ domain